ncbi:hypothetical protein [Oceanobacillus kimchii]|uniref:Uncharacterized protein n=1 Tax=Oceanobacillus kimchii TaxID=746691 RepID=A0ABQ5TH34_9BACI|nr:hypothetical protein [Oceanobacillus kimchii]GLO66188.1 hypothetical protein MACH08_19720 [Oceanobacillus kimchii]
MNKETNYRYLLFAYDSHEAHGGMEDLIFKFNSLKELATDFEFKDLYNYQLVDTSDFSYKEYTNSVIYRVGEDSYEEIVKRRKQELIRWLVEELK